MISIDLQPDSDIEPGHQWLVVPNNPEGLALVGLLVPRGHAPLMFNAEHIRIPHNESVDQNIVDLINALAHVRFQSPTLVQLTLQVAPTGKHADEEDGGLEGA
jgi:hypothetical protein